MHGSGGSRSAEATSSRRAPCPDPSTSPGTPSRLPLAISARRWSSEHKRGESGRTDRRLVQTSVSYFSGLRSPLPREEGGRQGTTNSLEVKRHAHPRSAL